MTDIVERLLEKRGIFDGRWPGPTAMDIEAAEIIERLRVRIGQLSDTITFKDEEIQALLRAAQDREILLEAARMNGEVLFGKPR